MPFTNKAKAQPKTGAKSSKRAAKSKITNLTPTELAVAEAVLDGKNFREAAAIAGCTPQNAGQVVKHSSDVKQYLEKHRNELSSAAQINRGDVIAGFMDAIDMARLSADPGSMIRGWSEIGKMLGLYAPEVKKVEVTAGQRVIQSKFEVMSDEELLEVISGGAVIDGECSTVR